jgi:hypothetical protein
MSRAPRHPVGSPWLYGLTLTLATAVAVCVALAPWINVGSWPLLALFAVDGTVRRTALASAVGLAVSAVVFFRPHRRPPSPLLARKSTKNKPTSSAPIGA